MRLLFSIVAIVAVQVHGNDLPCFRAGVFEHILINQYSDKVNDQTSNYYTRKNLAAYQEAAETAKLNGVQLLVFPEDGVFVPENRSDVYNFVERIPTVDPLNLITPCSDPKFREGSHSPGILRKLSCLAQDNNLYIVADIADAVKCDIKTDTQCLADGHYLYNTAVALDPRGQVVLKYHKYHLFGEFQYDVPKTQEYAILETPFGSFGVFICFDKMFKDPGITLVEQFNVTGIILTTWWFDEMPFLMAPQFHSAWSYTNGVNTIVANLKKKRLGSTGSGIYNGRRGPVAYHFDTTEKVGKPTLLMADLPVDPKNGEKCPANTKTVTFDYMKDKSKYRNKQVPVSGFDHVIIDNSSVYPVGIQEHICNGTFCCSLQAKLAEGQTLKNKYIFGVTNKIRSTFIDTGYEWCEEGCVFAAVNETGNGFVAVSKTSFESVTVEGNGFTTKYVYPSAMTNNYQLIGKLDTMQDEEGHSMLIVRSEKPLLMTGMYGRCYDRDPTYVRDDFNRAPILIPQN